MDISRGETDFRDWDGQYIKQFYDVLLNDGTLVQHCWPNAGEMVATDGSNRRWSPQDNIQIRRSPTHPADGK